MSRLAVRSALIALAASLTLSGCVIGRQPPTVIEQSSVEQRKMDVARLRDAGRISYEEAARRQFAIQRNAYTLTDGEMAFWRASIEYATMVDRRQITPAQYRFQVQQAYVTYVGDRPASG
ncbi:MAG TPA: hypothetical protein VMP03_12305 [Methylomirabilota bacterium]|nr:hypothetical protein [Methylomirabilota bacterium]